MDDNKGLPYFFLGLGVGVALGIVFAPKAGSEVRGLIKDRASEGGDYLKRRTEELKDSAGELVDKGRNVVGRQREQFNAAVDAGKQAYREALSSTAAEPTPGQSL